MEETTTATEDSKAGAKMRSPLSLDQLQLLIQKENQSFPVPDELKEIPEDNPWFLRVPVIAVGLAAIASLWFAIDLGPSVEFKDNAFDEAMTALGAMFVVALFVERAQQIYVAGWRGIRRATLDRRLLRWRNWRADAVQYQNAGDTQLEIFEGLEQTQLELAMFRQRTRKYVFLVGLSLGILIAASGPRILDQIVITSNGPQFKDWIFSFVDILITGGLVGGGSEAIHKIMVLITDTLDQTRKNVTRT
jgi:hypothetical protein